MKPTDDKLGTGSFVFFALMLALAFAAIGMVKEEVRNHRHVGDSVVVEVKR